jgi:hypothetical protein
MQNHLHAVFAPDVIAKREEVALQFPNEHIPGRTTTILAQVVFIPVSEVYLRAAPPHDRRPRQMSRAGESPCPAPLGETAHT